MDENAPPTIGNLPKNHTSIAYMDLSSTAVMVGVQEHIREDSLFIHIEGLPELVYLTYREGSLLIAAIRAAQSRIIGDEDDR